MEHDLKQYYGGCFPFGERKLESLLSLARIQIESQGVTRKPGGSSSTLPASSDASDSDVVPRKVIRDFIEVMDRSYGRWMPKDEDACFDAIQTLRQHATASTD
jgi:hypothetical protein